jgi:hypothetical protein
MLWLTGRGCITMPLPVAWLTGRGLYNVHGRLCIHMGRPCALWRILQGGGRDRWQTARTVPGTTRHCQTSLCTPAINEGCTRSLRISHTSRRAPLQPVSKTQVPCTPYRPPNRTGVRHILVRFKLRVRRDSVALGDEELLRFLKPVVDAGE